LISFDTSVRSLRGTGSTASREIGFAILSSRSLLSFWTWQAQGRGEIFATLKSIPAHGRAFVFRTAKGGGLAVGVKRNRFVLRFRYVENFGVDVQSPLRAQSSSSGDPHSLVAVIGQI
jgi:hypothetical protein